MERLKYNLEPQEQLLVSLYLKSMNKTQAARDAGYESTYIFDKLSVKTAIAEQLEIRAERLRVGSDWVLSELMRVYARCMQTEKVLDRDGNPTGEFHYDAANALKALSLIGKHVDVSAFEIKSNISKAEDQIREKLNDGRKRLHKHYLQTTT